MIFIGERINAGFKDIREAIVHKDASVLVEWAKKQAAAKATYLDVNVGTASGKTDDFLWMIDTVQNAVDLPISL